jgi:hypothetical protein
MNSVLSPQFLGGRFSVVPRFCLAQGLPDSIGALKELGSSPRVGASVKFSRKTRGDEVSEQFSEWMRATLLEDKRAGLDNFGALDGSDWSFIANAKLSD